jgi:hypothetical protein
MLVGASVLSLAVGSATADVRHHHRHLATSHAVQQAPAAAPAGYAEFSDNHNPAKKYPARHMPDGAIKTSTLPLSGNNPAKSYPSRHAPENAMHEATLPTSGNNPAKRYPVTASR